MRGHDRKDVDRFRAQRFLRRYPSWGRYGLSAFYVRDASHIDDLAARQLQGFSRLGLFRIADLRSAGFEVVPTFRTPHVTIAFTGDLVDRLGEMETARLELRPNPYHDEQWPTLPAENEEDR